MGGALPADLRVRVGVLFLGDFFRIQRHRFPAQRERGLQTGSVSPRGVYSDRTVYCLGPAMADEFRRADRPTPTIIFPGGARDVLQRGRPHARLAGPLFSATYCTAWPPSSLSASCPVLPQCY